MTRRAVTLVSLLLALLGSVGTASPAAASGDDYPWRTDTTSSADSFGFTRRQCVSFAAWELYQHGHRISNYSQHWGSAYRWDSITSQLGRRISSRPKVGSIAHWNAYEKSAYYTSTGVGTMTAGSQGHVAYVTAVYGDGSVRIEQYNMFGSRSFSVARVKAPRYLYIAG